MLLWVGSASAGCAEPKEGTMTPVIHPANF